MLVPSITAGLLFLASLVLCLPTNGQVHASSSTQSEPETQPEKTAATQAQVPAIKVHVNAVIVPVTVLDSKGEMVLDLAKDKFHIFDNGVEQNIEHFDLGGEPLAVVLVIECSSRVRMMAPAIHSLGGVFTGTVMGLEGRAAVISYDSTVDLRQPFTEDHDAVERAIRAVEFKYPESHLYDALSTAVELLKREPPNIRRVVLIVGESQDTASVSKLGLLLREVQFANISLYAVGPSSTAADLRYGTDGSAGVSLPGSLPPVNTTSPPRGKGGEAYFDFMTPAIWLLSRGTNELKNHQLEVAVASTGGVHYRAIRDQAIQSALDKIGGEINAQYILSYSPTTDDPPGFHKINVTVARPNSTVRARLGYFSSGTPDSGNLPGARQ